MKPVALTKAFKYKSTVIAVMQYPSKEGDKFKIIKKVINYVRGKNIESWRVMGSASTFTSLSHCMSKFEKLVNTQRKADGKDPIKFTVEE